MSNSISVTISGLATPDETLTANPTSTDQNVVYSYQWQSSADGTFDDAVPVNGNSANYVVAESDLGAAIRVIVTATDSSIPETTSATSAATAAVAPFEWIAGGGDWGAAVNWSFDAVPGANDDVVVSAAGATVTATGQAANEIQVGQNTTLSLNGTFDLGSGASGSTNQGTIDVNSGAQLNLTAPLTNNGTIGVTDGMVTDANGVTLNGGGTLEVSGGSVEGGLTLNGGSAQLGNGATVTDASGDNPGAVDVNYASVEFDGVANFANDVTLNQSNLYFGGANFVASTLNTDNGGTTNVDGSNDPNWTVSGPALSPSLQGVAAQAVDQDIVNNALAWYPDNSTSGWIAPPGWTDASNGSGGYQATNQPLASASNPYYYTTTFNVTDPSSTFLAGFIQADDTGELFLNGSTTPLLTESWYDGAAPFLLDAADGLVAGSNTLTVEMTNADGVNDGLRVQMVSAPTMIDQGVTIQGSGYVGDSNGSNVPDFVVNQGTIDANVSGGALTVAPAGFFNEGTVEATDGAFLYLGGSNWTNQSDGTVSAVNSTLLLDGTMNNFGQIATTDSVVFLNGSDTLSDLGVESYNATTGNTYSNFINTNLLGLDLSGQILLNPGDTLDATQGFFQNLTLGGGAYIDGGTVVVSAAAGGAAGELNIATGSNPYNPYLHDVTLENGGSWAIPGDSTVTIDGTIANSGTLAIQGAPSMGGAIMVVGGDGLTLEGGGLVSLEPNGEGASILSDGTGYDTPTLTNFDNTIQGAGVIGDQYLSVQNDGTIDANVAGQTLVVAPDGLLSNDGLMEATDGGILSIGGNGGTWTNQGDGTISATDSTLALAGPFNNYGTVAATNSTIQLQGAVDYTSGALTIQDNGGNNIVLNGTLTLDGDTLDTTQGLFQNMTVSGGTVTGGSIVDGAGGTLLFSGNAANTLSGVTVLGGLTITGGTVTLDDGTQILDSNGANLAPVTVTDATLGIDESFSNFASLSATDSTIELQGAVDYDSEATTIQDNGGNKVVVNGTLTLDGDTLDTTQGLFQNMTVDGGTVTGGTINDGAGGTLLFSGNAANTLSDVTIQGGLVVNGGDVTLSNDVIDGGLTVENGGVVTLDNATQILDSTGSVPGPITLDNGEIQDGTLDIDGGLSFGPSGQGTLHDVTVVNTTTQNFAGGAVVGSSGNIVATLTFDGTLNNSGVIGFGSQPDGAIDLLQVGGDGLTLAGGGTISVSSAYIYSSSYYGEAAEIASDGSAATLTNVDNTIEGYGILGDANLVIQNDGTAQNGESAPATIDANVDYQTLYLAPDGLFTNDGLAEATNGGTLQIGGGSPASSEFLADAAIADAAIGGGGGGGGAGWTNATDGVIEAGAGSTLALYGPFANQGTISATNATLSLNGPLTNSGTITTSGSIVDLGGDFTLEDLGDLSYAAASGDSYSNFINSNGSTLNIDGTLNLDTVDSSITLASVGEGDTLDATQGFFQNAVLSGGEIEGGTIIVSAAAGGPTGVLGIDSGTIHDALIENPGAWTIGGNAYQTLSADGVLDNIGTIQLGNSYNSSGYIYIGQDGLTLEGGGTINLDGYSYYYSPTEYYIYDAAIQGVGYVTTFENVDNTITGVGTVGGYNLAVQNDHGGTIDANVNGQVLAVASSGSFSNDGVAEATNGGVLAIGGNGVSWTNQSDGTIDATGSTLVLGGAFVNDGKIVVTSSTLGVNFDSAPIANSGSFAVSSSTVDLDGAFTLEDLGSFTYSASSGDAYTSLFADFTGSNTINIYGTVILDTTDSSITPASVGVGDTLDFTQGFFQNVILGNGAAIDGGTVIVSAAAGGATGVMTLASGANVTIHDALVENAGTLTVGGGNYESLTVDGVINNTGTITIGSSNSYVSDYLHVGADGLKLEGQGTVNLTPYPYYYYYYTSEIMSAYSPATLENVDNTIQGAGEIGDYDLTVQNDHGGTIDADLSGQELVLAPYGLLSNDGTVEATNGATLQIGGNGGSWTNQSDGTISATDATLILDGPFTNLGTISATDSTVEIGGTVTLAELGTVQRSGGTMELTGTLDLGGATLDTTQGEFQGLVLDGGTIENGTVIGGGLTLDSGTLGNVTYQGGLSVNGGSLTVENGLRVEDSTGATPGNISVSSYNSLVFDDTQTLDNATVTLSGSYLYEDTTYAAYQANGYSSPTEALTLGSNLTLDVTGGYNYFYSGGYYNYYGSGTSTIVNNGAINVESGAYLEIEPQYFVNNGAIAIASSATLDLTSLSGDGQVDVGASALLDLTGNIVAGDTIDMTGAGATVEIGSSYVYNYSTDSYDYTPYSVGASISGFVAGDHIVVDNVDVTNAIYASTGFDTGTLSLYDVNALVDTLTLTGADYTDAQFTPDYNTISYPYYDSTILTVSTTPVPPTLSIGLADDTGSNPSANITSNAALTGVADPNAVVNLTIDGNAPIQVTTNAFGVWTYTPVGLADGHHNVVASETNSFGLTGTATVNFTLATTAPTVTISPTVTVDQVYSNSVELTVTGTVASSNGLSANVALYRGAVTPSDLLGYASIDNGAWSANIDLPGGQPATVNAVASDAANNASPPATLNLALNPADMGLSASAGTLTFDGENYVLNLGSALYGGPTSANLDFTNTSGASGDAYSGSLTETSDQGFTNSGAGSFANLGDYYTATAESVSLTGSAPGDYSETFNIQTTQSSTGASKNATLTVEGAVQAAPVLVVSGVTAPSSANGGGQALVSWTLTNDGDADAVGPWTDDVYLATDASGDGRQLLGSFAFEGIIVAGASIALTVAVALPADASGDDYFVVQADATNVLVENPAAPSKESVAASATSITPAPAPDIVVSGVTQPTEAYSGQQTQVSWVVANDGTASTGATSWTDQIYLSPTPALSYGLHQAINGYLLASVPNASYLAPGDEYSNSATVTIPKDLSGPFYIVVVSDQSAVGGSSQFTVDLSPSALLQVTQVEAPPGTFSGQPVTLSWTVANNGPASTDVSSWSDSVYLSTDGSFDSSSILLGSVGHSGVLGSGSSYTQSATVTTPVGLSGNFTFFVVADANNQVDQGPVHGVDKGSTSIDIILTPPPQLDVNLTGAPTAGQAGQQVTVSYDVANTGSSTTPNTSWTDNIYLSSDGAVDSGSILLASLGHYGALAVGQSYAVSTTVTLPRGISGPYYLVVETDAGNQVFQINRSDDVAASSPVAISNPVPELEVSNVTAPTLLESGHQAAISWVVTNQGVGGTPVASGWTDNIVLSASGVPGASDNIVLASVEDPNGLAPGASYTQSAVVNLPITLAGGAYSLFVVADANSGVTEANPTASVSTATPVNVVQSLAELDVTAISAPGAATAGNQVSVGWTVDNVGVAATNASYWFDDVYLSATPGLSGGAEEIGSFEHANPLAAGASYSDSETVQLPQNLATGTYYLVVQADAGGQIVEATGASVTDVSGPISVTAASASSGGSTSGGGATSPSNADLTATSVATPAQTLSGQDFTVSWTVANNSGVAQGGGDDLVYLSLDQVIDPSDYYLGAVSQSALAAGASETFTETFAVPAGVSGNYYVLVAPDEESTSYANVGVSNLMQVAPPPHGAGASLPSLVTTDVEAPTTTVSPGSSLSITYTVQDQGSGDAEGDWTDAVYLSTTPEWTTSAILLGNAQHTGNVAAGDSYTGTFDATVPGVAPGNYYVIVRPNIRGNVPEASNANGAGASAQTVSVGLPTLTLGAPVTGTLSDGQTQYYEFTASAGETINLSLSTDTPDSINNIYVKYGSIPTIGQFDAASASESSADPSVTFQTTQAGVYYVMVDANSVAGTENYTLEGQTVAYSISSITPKSGSDLGSVTLTIDGAQLDANEKVEIVASDGTVYDASQVQWVSGTQMYATFDLQGVPTGTYSVEIQDGAQSSTLANAFKVNNGPAGQLSLSLSTPQYLRIGDIGAALVTYTNTGDTDISAPILDVTSNGSILAQAGSSGSGGNSITFLGTGSTGPAGVIQPGESETRVFFITPTSPSPHSVFQINLNAWPSNVAIDWSSLESAFQPATVDSADWNNVWTAFVDSVGTTTTSFENALAADASELAAAGAPTTDIATLVGYQMLQAAGGLQQAPLTSVTDLEANGILGLTLSRTYDGLLLNRDQVGLFGEGWTSTYDISAVTDSSGDVYVTLPSGIETFTLQSDGAYVDTREDGATLAVDNGLYVMTDAAGDVTRFLANGKLDSITDANGNTITANWSAAGTLASVTDSDGESIAFTTNSAGCITSATDSDGQTVTYTYNSAGDQLLSASGPDGVTSYTYASATSATTLDANALTEIVNPDGTTESFTYDSQGRLASQTGSGGSGAITYSYPSAGEVVETDALGNSTTLLYNTNGQVAQAENATGDVVNLQYNASDQLTEATEPDGSAYSYTYNASGNVTTYTDPQGDTVTATYAPGTNELTQLTDQLGDKIQYTYNSAGDLTGVTYENGSGATYTYGASGLLLSSADGEGDTTTYSYDSAGNLTHESFSDGSSQSYSYNSAGELTSATATDGGVTTYAYNSAGQLIGETNPQGQVLSYAYNSEGELSSLTDPNGAVTNYSYNSAGRLTSMTDGSGNLIESYTYNAANQLTGETMGNGASTQYSYNANGAPIEILSLNADGTTASDYRYSYNGSGQVVGVATTDGAWTYGYNASGEMTESDFASTNSSIQSQTISYVYDAAGNLVSSTDNGVVTNYTTNGLDQYVQVGDTTYTYNADGEMTSAVSPSGVTTYTYNDVGELASVVSPTGTTTYTYDALGNVVSTDANGVVSNDIVNPLALDTAATGPLAALAQVYNASGNVAATYDYGANGLAAVDESGATGYYITDLTDNVTGVSGADGALVDSYDYLPYGGVLASTGALANPFQFAGGLGDVSSDGLVDMRARYYDVATGRFISMDPTGAFGGSNPYAYVNNTPALEIDPSGEFGFGNLDSAGAEGGVPGAGSGASGSAGIGTFFDNGTGQVSQGAFYSGGAFSQLGGQTNNTVNYPSGSFVAGGSAGVGTGVYITNGNNVGDLSGPFDTWTLNLPFISVQFAIGSNSQGHTIWTLSGTVGASVGASFSRYPTNTWTTNDPKNNNSTTQNVENVTPQDPNAIVGPAGFGPQAFVSGSAPLGYTVDFQNEATASAPAQDVTIAEQLDPNLDWRTFRITSFGFDQQTYVLTGSQAFYSTTIDLSATKGYDVFVAAAVNVATGVVTWTFDTIDPATGETPTNPEIGFLPVDDGTGIGDGFVSYTVQARSADVTGAAIGAQAQVVFDNQPPLDTATITNTVDAVAPTSSVQALPAQTAQTQFEVSWSGVDDSQGSGVASYTILVSEDGGPVTAWLTNTTQTNAIFTGEDGHIYAFSSIAADNAGNVEAPHATPDTTIEVGTVAPANLALTPASISGPSKTADITNDATPVVTGSADPGASVTLYDGSTAIGTTTADATTGAWSLQTPTLADGAHVLTATAVNATGVASPNSAPLDVTIKTAPPVVTITSAGGFVGSLQQTIAGTLDTNDAGETVTVLDGGTAIGTAQSDSVTGDWSANVTLSNNGANAITAQATDAAGNVGTSSPATFTLVQPTVSVGVGDSQLTEADDTTAVTFTFSAAPSDFSLTDVKATGGTLSTLIGSGDVYTATYTADANTDLASATVSVTNQSYHVQGVAGAGATSAVFAVDTIPPTVSAVVVSPANVIAAPGTQIEFVVSFDEAVSVSGGVPAFTLSNGGVASYDATATAALGASDELAFTYTVGSGQASSGLEISGVTNGATVADAYGNAADFSAALSQAFNNVIVAGGAPLVIDVAQAVAIENGTTVLENPDGLAVTVEDVANSLTKLSAANITALAALGVTQIEASDTDVFFTTAQKAALGTAGITLEEPYSGGSVEIQTFNADGSTRNIDYLGVTGKPYTSIDVAYANGKVASENWYNGTTLYQTETWNADGSYDILHDTAGSAWGQPYASYDFTYTSAGVLDQETFYSGANGAGAIVASETLQSNGGYELTIDGALHQTKTVNADGSYDLLTEASGS
ncbi:CARDB domain-containing protein, partial [Rhodoblastus sp.]|uniref:CARDB domain-containing protein n=1 Tax=Rhodoblastus sp. TaxID=1962975 RepID=UPI003F950947